jgi:DNA polymerase elongation subunit (family B)
MTERLEAKKAGDKGKAEALKIIINSFYGNFNYPYFYAYDPKSAYTVTINGQLYLLMLVEQLEFNGYAVISANTDGVTYLRKAGDADD